MSKANKGLMAGIHTFHVENISHVHILSCNVISWLNSNDFANLLDAFKEILCDCAENISTHLIFECEHAKTVI